MKTDQDLIFEAYTKTLNEGSHLYGDTELGPGKYKASDVTITDYDIEDLAPVGVGGGYEMVPVEFEDDNGTTMTGIVDSLYIDDTGAVDASGMIHDAEVGTLEEDNESREENIRRGEETITADQEEYYKQFGADKFEDQFGFRYPEEDAEGGGSGILEQLEIFMSNNPATEQELAPILNELLEVAEELVRFDEFMDGEDQDEYLYLLNKLSTTAKT
jgi:hypothetical protein